jgi:hypothetical protein
MAKFGSRRPRHLKIAASRLQPHCLSKGANAMSDTTFAGDDVTVVQTAESWGVAAWSGVSWSGVIAGALTATAVWVILVALGSGIGLTLASPFSSSPSAGTLTIMGAVWLVLAQGIGAATGGYMAGRLRSNPSLMHSGEVKFRDGASGLVVWAIGVVLSLVLVASAADKLGSAAGTAATAGVAAMSGQAPSLDYFSDTLLRTNPQAPASGGAAGGSAAAGAAPPNGQPNGTNDNLQRQQVNRILLTALGPNGLSNDDRTYLAQIVSAQSGVSMDDAQKRVDDVVNRARAEAAQAADTARKGAAYLAFWTFMSLLFGAVCATLGGMLGGELRDEFATARAVPTTSR